jgi:tetratricopeptide (TPR) repeat protein
MKILLFGLGNSPIRSEFGSLLCENYLKQHIPGHEIMTFGYNEGVNIRIDIGDGFEEVIKRLPENWIPDFCLLWEIEWSLLPKGMESVPFPIVALISDWDYDISLLKRWIECVDLIITTSEFEKNAFQIIGGQKVLTFYYIGIMKEFFNKSPKKIGERKYDIFYTYITAGLNDILYPNRCKWILRLCSLADKYNILIESALGYKDYLSLLRDSKLAFSHHRFESMSPRALEAGAQGCIVVEVGSETSKYFLSDKEFISLNEKDFQEMIEQHLKDINTLQKMSDRFYTKITQNFESRSRFLQLLELINKELDHKMHLRKTASISEDERFIRRGEYYYYSFFRFLDFKHYRSPGKSRIPGKSKSIFMDKESKLLLLSIEEFKKAINIKPTPRAIVNFVVAQASFDFLFNSNKMEKSCEDGISLLNDIISSYPSYVMAHYNLGLLQMRIGNNEEALRIFHTALKLFKDKKSFVDPWCLQNRDFELFNKILRPYLNRNLLLLCKGEEDEAMRNIRKLHQAMLLYLASKIEEKNGHIYKVLDILLEAYSLHSECALIAKDAAKTLAILGHKEKSLEMYRKAIDLLPINIDLRIEYINLLYYHQMDSKVIEEIDEILKIIKRVRKLNGKAKEVEALMERFRRFTKSPYSYDRSKEKLLHDWIVLLCNYLKKDSTNLKLVLRIVELLNESGRMNEALEVLERFILNIKDKEVERAVYSEITKIYKWIQNECKERHVIFKEKLSRLQMGLSALT